MLIQLLKLLYLVSGTITVLGYIPTLIDLIKKKPSANIQTYSVLTITRVISTLYAGIITQDLLFTLTASGQLLICLPILFLSIKLKAQSPHLY